MNFQGCLHTFSVALPQELLYVVLCVLGYTTLLRKIRVVLGHIASFSATYSKITCSNWMTSWASFVYGLLRLL